MHSAVASDGAGGTASLS